MSKTTPPKARQAKKKSSASNGEAVNDKPLPAPFNKALPSQFELATLAAALDRPENTLKATAEHALDVWKACGKALEFEILREEFASIKKERLAQLGFGQRALLDKTEIKPNGTFILKLEEEPMPLLDFLKPHFSKNSKSAHMLKKFRDFLREETEDLDDDEETLFRRVAKYMKEYREYGVLIDEAAMLSLRFTDFLKHNGKALGKEKGLKGAAAKKAKAEARKAAGEKKSLGSKKPRPKQKKAGRKQ